MSYPNQPGQGPLYSSQFYPPPPRPSGPNWLLIILGVMGGGVLLVGLACCGGVAFLAQPPKASAQAKVPFSVAEIPPPFFPERGAAEEYQPEIIRHTVMLGGQTGGYYSAPGHGGYLYVYLPPGEHAPASLPCVLICGAGSDLLSGMSLGEGDVPEHLPYVQAGCAVLAYELDGPNSNEDVDPDAMRKAFEAFAASRAGLVNGRNALEYVLAKVPEVDPSQIYAAGHSSAATHALLFAEHEPQLAGVIAYAPAIYLPERFEETMGMRLVSILVPGSVDFVTKSDPATHIAQLKCPALLFHAEDDGNCPIESTRKFADQLQQQGTDVTLITVPTGDHYKSMINEGIPAGIRWLRERAK